MCGVDTNMNVSKSPVLRTHRNGQAAFTQDKLGEMARPFFALSVNVATECRQSQPQGPPPDDISVSCICQTHLIQLYQAPSLAPGTLTRCGEEIKKGRHTYIKAKVGWGMHTLCRNNLELHPVNDSRGQW